MIERLTDAELTQIRERAEQATEGPWVSVKEHGVVNDEEMICFMGVTGNEVNDATFIANARTDIPKLLAEIERLQALVMSHETMLDYALDGIDDVRYEDIHAQVSDYLYGGEGD